MNLTHATCDRADQFNRTRAYQRSTVKARCSELRYSDYLVVAIGLACTDLVHTQYNDYFVVTMIVMLLLFPW
jgi:hypothetical protein